MAPPNMFRLVSQNATKKISSISGPPCIISMRVFIPRSNFLVKSYIKFNSIRPAVCAVMRYTHTYTKRMAFFTKGGAKGRETSKTRNRIQYFLYMYIRYACERERKKISYVCNVIPNSISAYNFSCNVCCCALLGQ